ncbi:MAG: 5-formyltetrahydrofolate cyclo-ligase [Candidatus Omnitrophota bacterium]
MKSASSLARLIHSPSLSINPELAEGLTKAKIRSKMIRQLKIQKEENRDRKSRIITEKLLRTKVFKQAKRVMFYVAFGGEVNTKEMIEKAREKAKTVTVPVCRKNRISLRPALLDVHAALARGPYGVSEPVYKNYLHLKDLDLVVVPGLAFDKSGNRLGRGKGCYDRFLNKLPKDTPTIGLAFGFQILPCLPTTKRDVSVKQVLFA